MPTRFGREVCVCVCVCVCVVASVPRAVECDEVCN